MLFVVQLHFQVGWYLLELRYINIVWSVNEDWWKLLPDNTYVRGSSITLLWYIVITYLHVKLKAKKQQNGELKRVK